MKFTEHLSSHLTPEWRSQYVSYEEIKKFLYAAEEKLPSSEEVNEEIVRRHFAKYEDGFFLFCDKELTKINTFFAEKLAEATRKFNELETLIANSGISDSTSKTHDAIQAEEVGLPVKPSAKANSRKLKELKFAVSEFYLSLILIQNFQQLNSTGFRKILKKHDKLFKTTTGVEYRQQKIETAPFFTNKQTDELILQIEEIFIYDLEHGNRGKAMNRLRVLPLAERQTHSASFVAGLFSGGFIALFIVLILTVAYKYEGVEWEPALRMYRGLFLIIIMIAFLGMNVYGWSKAGVNHILIFELNPRDHLIYMDLFKLSSFFGILWCISGIAYFFTSVEYIPRLAHPLALTGCLLAFFVNPTSTFHYTARIWLLKILCRIFAAPFFAVRFADFWLADQLNSLVIPMKDMQYLVCFYSYEWYHTNDKGFCNAPRSVIRPIIALLPAWWRFAQCARRYKDTRKGWPHLVNAGKYMTSMLITIFSTLAVVQEDATGENGSVRYVWIFSMVVGTCYTLFWDLRMDWGLFDKNAGDNHFLRDQIVYDSKIYYYLAIFADVFFRLTWTLTISVGDSGFIHNELFTVLIGLGEAFRRFVWNFFRLENEHLNNCGQFRAVRDISIKPIHANNAEGPITLEHIMDHEEGPLPKRRVVDLLLDGHVSDHASNNQHKQKKISFIRLKKA